MRKPKKPAPKMKPFNGWYDPDYDLAGRNRDYKREIRVRVTPIRKPTDAEVEKLAQKLYEAGMRTAPMRFPTWSECMELHPQQVIGFRAIARAAWKAGAR